MITREIPVSLTLPPSKTARSAGVHVSSIIRCIATETGILKAEWAEELSLTDAREITDKVAILRISIGLAWEEHYIPLLAEVIDHPGEMEVDGVYMTHDGESVSVVASERGDRLVLKVHEVKATYKSTKTVGNLEGQWMWLAQVKAYCQGLGTRFAVIHVLFLCGDYKFPIKPVLKVWELEFTQDEIDDNWNLLRDYKEHLEAQIKDKENWLE